VERRQPHALSRGADERLHALAHLLRRFVRERDRQHFTGLGVAVADQIGDPERDDACLARPCTREDQQRAVTMQDSFFLSGSTFQKVHGESIISSVSHSQPGLRFETTDDRNAPKNK
jgi:hypothetical protein